MRRLRPSSAPIRLEAALRRHVWEQVCPERGWDPDDCRLEVPLRGTAALVRTLHGPQGEGGVTLRLHMGSDLVKLGQSQLRSTDLLRAHGIATPKTLRVTRDFGGTGTLLTEEENLSGVPLDRAPRTEATWRAAAETVGAMHSVRSPMHGDPRTPKEVGYATATMGRFSNQMRSLANPGPATAKRADRVRLLRWARRWTHALETLREHSLKHGDLSGPHLLVREDAPCALVDVISVRWGSPARDMVQLHRRVFATDPEGWEVFRGAHSGKVGEEIAGEIDRLWPLFEVLHHVDEAAFTARLLRRGERRRGRRASVASEDRFRQEWARAMEIVAVTDPPAKAERR